MKKALINTIMNDNIKLIYFDFNNYVTYLKEFFQNIRREIVQCKGVDLWNGWDDKLQFQWGCSYTKIGLLGVPDQIVVVPTQTSEPPKTLIILCHVIVIVIEH